MFDHVDIRVSDREASQRFYDTVLSTLGIAQTANDVQPAAGHAEVDAFWQAGSDAGYRDDGAPGPRPQYVEDHYGAFLLDPDGNSAEVGNHHR
jgi:hypothetical protein